MLSCLLSRLFSQAVPVAELNCRYPFRCGVIFRAFRLSTLNLCEHSDNGSTMVAYYCGKGLVVTERPWTVRLCDRKSHWFVYIVYTTQRPLKAMDGSVVAYDQLKTMLSMNNIQLFDVRNTDEFQAGRIPESVNIPLDLLEESLKLSPEQFKQIFQVKAPGKADDNIVFHCQRGNRSLKALDIARQLGFSRARHYKGGYVEWTSQEGK